MKVILSIVFFGSLIFNPAFANKSNVVVAAIDYSCEEMQDIVAAHAVVFVEGLGSRNVYASEEAACVGEFPDTDSYSYASYWETNDVSACRVGYACRAFASSDDGGLGDGDIPDVKK